MGFMDGLGPRRRDQDDKPGDAEHRGLASSAKRLQIDNKRALKRDAAKRQEWQDEAWDYFDDVPEIKATTWLGGNVMSKLKLYVAVRPIDDPDGDPIPAIDPESGITTADAMRAQAELDRVKSPLGGRSEIIRAFSMNLEIAAELYLHMRGPRAVPATDTTDEYVTNEEWAVRSVDEVEVANDKVKIHRQPGDSGEELNPALDDIVRVWQRHPRWSYMPDCNMRGVLSECEAVVLLSNQVKAVAKSASSAGFFTLPNELGFNVGKPTDEGDIGDDDADDDPFRDQMQEQLTNPIEDPSDASSVQPMLIRGQAEFLHPDFLRHITLERKADETLDQRIEARIERIARGLNYPVETVKGHADTTFANASQIDEDKFRDHYEPKCVTLCDALTVGVLQPYLTDSGMAPETVDRLMVWFDASGIMRSLDPAESADQGYTLGTISDAAWRRVKGWTEDDAPDPVERLVRALLRLRSLDPGLSTAIVELLGVPLNIPAVVPAGETVGEGTQPPVDDEKDIPSPPMSMLGAILELHQAKQEHRPVRASARREIEPALAAGGLKAVLAAHNNPGRQLMDIDRNLRAKLAVSADRAMTRVLERAGNRLKAKAPAATKQLIRTVHPVYAAAQLGPRLVASAGFTDDDLIGTDAWDTLERQFLEWGAGAQSRAIQVANRIVGLSSAERQQLQVRQAGDLTEAWSWMKDQLHDLATRRLYEPDPHAVNVGEFDPTSKVPTGLIRQAISRAGGASGLTVQNTNPYVVLNNGSPPGGIGTGELISTALADNGTEIDAYEWVYGPAYRLHPFEEHENLDGETFVNFDSDVLAAGDWIGDYYFPGDHDGCNCDFVPVIVSPGDISNGEN